MVNIDTIYKDIGKAMKGICDMIYAKNRPKSVDKRPSSYIVVRLPSGIFNQEIGYDGAYNDYTTTAQIEVYVRNKVSRSNANGFDIGTTSDKVSQVLKRFPIDTENLTVVRPIVTMQADDGDGFDVTIIQGQLRTK